MDSLNQISIRVPAIHAPQIPYRACPLDNLAAFEDLNPSTLPACFHLLNRMLSNEAQICTAWLYALGLGLEFLAGLVEVDLLAAEGQCVSAVCD